jgi:hypothetical protein
LRSVKQIDGSGLDPDNIANARLVCAGATIVRRLSLKHMRKFRAGRLAKGRMAATMPREHYVDIEEFEKCVIDRIGQAPDKR